jgi:diadenylate cyclase
VLQLHTIAEIALLAVAYFFILSSIRGTRGYGILKGLIFFIILAFFGATFIARELRLYRIEQVLQYLLGGSSIAAIVIFAPELRRFLLRLSRSRFFSVVFRGAPNKIVGELVTATTRLAANRHGALIAIERDVGLGEYVEKGSRLDTPVTSDLIETLFYPGTPLHDGAIVIQHERIAAAACFFPLSDDDKLAKSMGTRHRAALGVCEETDAVVIVVSEETGRISICTDRKFKSDLTRDDLERELRDLYERGSLAVRTKRFFSPPTIGSMPSADGGGSNGAPAKPAEKPEKKEDDGDEVAKPREKSK